MVHANNATSGTTAHLSNNPARGCPLTLPRVVELLGATNVPPNKSEEHPHSATVLPITSITSCKSSINTSSEIMQEKTPRLDLPLHTPTTLKSCLKKFTIPSASLFAQESKPLTETPDVKETINENYLLSFLSITDERFATEEELYDIREDDDSTFVGPKEFIRTLNY